MAEFIRLTQKINEIKKFAETGLSDLKSTGIASLEGNMAIKKGYPIFIGGAPHSGKTEFTFEILVNLSIQYGWKHFVYCGEGGNVEHIYYELLHKHIQKPYKYATESEKINSEYFINEHFIVCNHDLDFTIDEFYKAVEKTEKALNIKFDTTVFDPFNDIKDETELFGGREDKYLAYALKKVRISSKMNNRVDILVNHIADIRAIVHESGNRYMPPAMPNEWAGGRTWWRRGFLMLLVYRPPIFFKDLDGNPPTENETHIYVQKAKPKGVAKLGVSKIFWDWKKNRYYSYNEHKQLLYSCEKLEDTTTKMDILMQNQNIF
ncbi:MAG: hypothetical protein ABI241_00720 [Bacteroidia bacterium]